MTLKLYKPLFFSLFLMMFYQSVFAQNYSEDITDASTGIIEAVSAHGGSVPNLAEYAFDENITTQGWANNSASDFPAWISYEFPDTVGAKNVVAYSFYCSDDQSNFWSSTYIPVRWTLEGENSDGLFLLDSVEMADINMNEWQLFEFKNTQYFDKYIFTFYETAGNAPFAFITEMELYEPATPLSTSQVNSAPAIAVYPNPVSDILTISTKEHGVFDISVFNELGQKVDFLNNARILDNLQLDCSRYGKGVYSLVFQNKNGWSTKRIVVTE